MTLRSIYDKISIGCKIDYKYKTDILVFIIQGVHMKIISGRFKGRNFYPAKGSKARPTSNKVREALFNILYDKIKNAVVIDLFAGSGGFGLEALSRNCSKVYFCDYDRKSIHALQEYLDNFGIHKREYGIYSMDYSRAMAKMESEGVYADVIYVDPPYSSDVYETILEKCVPLIKMNATIIIEYDKRTNIAMNEGYVNIQSKHYGNTVVDLFRYEGET